MSVNPRPRPAFTPETEHGEADAARTVTPPVRALEHPRRPEKQPEKQLGRRPGKQPGKKGTKKQRPAKDEGKEVALVLRLPKPLRKRLRAKAAELDMTAEDAAAQVVRMWVDG